MKKRMEESIEEYKVEQKIREKQVEILSEQGRSNAAQQMNAVDVHIGLRELKKPLQNPCNFYTTLIHEIKNLLDGISDSLSFEDNLRFIRVPCIASILMHF